MFAHVTRTVGTLPSIVTMGTELLESIPANVVESVGMSLAAGSLIKSTSSNNNPGRRDRKSGNRRDGGSSGSGSDDDSEDSVWRKFKASKPRTMRHLKNSSRTFQRVGYSKFWLSRDHAMHGGSFFKLYIEKGSTFDFVGSVPIKIFRRPIYQNPQRLDAILKSGAELEDFDIINKAESHGGEQIKKNDLKLVN